jgi:hypothetical protein
MNKHKWYNEIVAWAMGCQIEEFAYGEWEERDQPKWHLNYQYRIKPQPKQPKYLYFYNAGGRVSCEKDKIEGWGSVYLGKIEVQDD